MPHLQRFVAPALALALSGCFLKVPSPDVAPRGRRVVQVLHDTPERETSQLNELRLDVEIDTHDFERTPHVVARGETPAIELGGAHARLFGDSGSKGWSVDNIVLFEVLGAGGQVVNRFCVGFSDPVQVGSEQVDNVGRLSFNFDPGEIDITERLPERGPFKIRATVLDYYGVGRVTDLFVVLDASATHTTSDDELRFQ